MVEHYDALIPAIETNSAINGELCEDLTVIVVTGYGGFTQLRLHQQLSLARQAYAIR